MCLSSNYKCQHDAGTRGSTTDTSPRKLGIRKHTETRRNWREALSSTAFYCLPGARGSNQIVVHHDNSHDFLQLTPPSSSSLSSSGEAPTESTFKIGLYFSNLLVMYWNTTFEFEDSILNPPHGRPIHGKKEDIMMFEWNARLLLNMMDLCNVVIEQFHISSNDFGELPLDRPQEFFLH